MTETPRPGRAAPIDVPLERFEQLVADALDSIPPELGSLLDNVVVQVSDEPAGRLYGLYEGIPLTRRHNYGALAMPDRITIFRRTILRHATTEDRVVELVRRTVIHEVAHHFGISDARLRELGW
ncbi:MAG TPA: metallopeptidase family protein [Acidimicrobiales bacterium]